MQSGDAGFYTVLPLVFLLSYWLAGRVVGVVRRMTIDCWALSLHGNGHFARTGYCLVQGKEQRAERERERGRGCFEERQLLDMWGIPTYNTRRF